MKQILFIVFIGLSITSFAQVDSVKLKSDTIAINDNKIRLSQVAEKIIDANEAELSSFRDKIKESQDELKRLERLSNRNENDIAAKKQMINKLVDSSNTLTTQLRQTKTVLQAAINEYDSIKNNLVKMRKDSATLASQQDTIRQTTEKLVAKTSATQAEYNRLLVEIAKKEDSLEAIAKIKLKAKTILLRGNPHKFRGTQYLAALSSAFSAGDTSFNKFSTELARTNNHFAVDSAKIETVHLLVKEGRIAEIIVKTNKGVFRNFFSQIDLVHFSEQRNKARLYKDDEDYNDTLRYFIFPGDAISYEPIRSYGDIPYSEFEITLTAGNDGDTYIIRENTSINTYFEVAAFTDVNGIAGNANGLAQITASAKFITSTRHLGKSNLMGLQFISFNGGLAKFDNDFKGTFISPTDSVNRKDLFQRAQYAVGVKANLFRFVRSPYPNLLFNDLQLNAGFNFLGSKIADTLTKFGDTLFRTVTHNQFYLEPVISFSRQKNFNMSISVPIFYQNIKESALLANSGWEWWICPSINLMYYSKRDSKSKIFFRYNHFINLNNKKQAFNQMQLGYAANLTNIMQGKQ